MSTNQLTFQIFFDVVLLMFEKKIQIWRKRYLSPSFLLNHLLASVVSDSVWPHRQQSTRLPCPWDSPDKNTGVGCHCLLQSMKVKSESEVTQSCPTLSDPMDCSLPGSSTHGIFQARVLEWGAIAFSRRASISQLFDVHYLFNSLYSIFLVL